MMVSQAKRKTLGKFKQHFVFQLTTELTGKKKKFSVPPNKGNKGRESFEQA
jgi:hypothetical protein